MSEDSVLYDVQDAVALITLNRPDKLNAFTAEMHHRFCRLLAHADADPQVRAVVVTGAGRGFCAGADLEALATINDGDFVREDPDDPYDLGVALTMSTPLIAAVNGPTAGMGFSYLLMADVRFFSETAKVGSTFARLGLVAEWGSAPLLRAIVGSANAADLLLSGRTIDAAEAFRLGIAQRVVPAETLLADALAYARDLADNCAPWSHAQIKEQLRDPDIRALFEDSLERMLESFRRPDLAEALAARTEKRAVRFAPNTP
jgi:enoyl-CoA hydratase/carnithine racemase